MGALNTEPNLAAPDDFYDELIGLHRGLTEGESALVNAKLILLLANHIGDPDVLRAAMAAAREDVGTLPVESASTLEHPARIDMRRTTRPPLPIRLRQRIRHRGAAGRVAGRTQFAAARALRPVCGTAFGLGVHGAAGSNRRSWTYRIRPAAMHLPFARIDNGRIVGRFGDVPTPPNQLRWDPLPIPTAPTDFVDGLVTMAGNGDPAAMSGCGIHVYAANRSMQDRFFYDADGELLILPQQGRLRCCHRVRPHRRRAAGDRRHSARRALPRRFAGCE